MLTDYLTGQTVPRTPQEEVRQVAARFLVESLGYPKESLAANVPLAHDHQESFIAALVVMRPDEASPLVVVEAAAPGSSPPAEVPQAVADSGTQFYFWFDGFFDDPRRGPISWGSRYFERHDAGFAPVPSLPHHHQLPKRRRRRPPTRQLCPHCGRRLELFCSLPCTDDCRHWSCHWYGLLYCRDCQRSWTRPRPTPKKPNK